MRETTALGAAIAAGFAVDVWKEFDELKEINQKDRMIFKPNVDKEEGEKMFKKWGRVSHCRSNTSHQMYTDFDPLGGRNVSRLVRRWRGKWRVLVIWTYNRDEYIRYCRYPSSCHVSVRTDGLVSVTTTAFGLVPVTGHYPGRQVELCLAFLRLCYLMPEAFCGCADGPGVYRVGFIVYITASSITAAVALRGSVDSRHDVWVDQLTVPMVLVLI